jgi:hypothetical protein
MKNGLEETGSEVDRLPGRWNQTGWPAWKWPQTRHGLGVMEVTW